MGKLAQIGCSPCTEKSRCHVTYVDESGRERYVKDDWGKLDRLMGCTMVVQTPCSTCRRYLNNSCAAYLIHDEYMYGNLSVCALKEEVTNLHEMERRVVV